MKMGKEEKLSVVGGESSLLENLFNKRKHEEKIIVIRKLCESHDDDVRGCEIKKRKKEKIGR